MTSHRPRAALRVPVEGMTCQSCVVRISRAVGRIEGVRSVRVDLGRELVSVERETGAVADVAIADAIEAAGYHARIHEASCVEVAPGFLQRLLHH